jgi:hypothetical protein
MPPQSAALPRFLETFYCPSAAPHTENYFADFLADKEIPYNFYSESTQSATTAFHKIALAAAATRQPCLARSISNTPAQFHAV